MSSSIKVVHKKCLDFKLIGKYICFAFLDTVTLYSKLYSNTKFLRVTQQYMSSSKCFRNTNVLNCSSSIFIIYFFKAFRHSTELLIQHWPKQLKCFVLCLKKSEFTRKKLKCYFHAWFELSPRLFVSKTVREYQCVNWNKQYVIHGTSLAYVSFQGWQELSWIFQPLSLTFPFSS